MVSKELVISNNDDSVLVAQDDFRNAMIPGAENIQREDMLLPRLVLVQAQSQKVPEPENHVGQWYNTLTGEFKKSVEGVLMGLVKFRVMFPQEYGADSDPICKSNDGLYPNQEYIGAVIEDISIEPTPCATCPFAQFTESADGTSKPPRCSKGYSYAFLDLDTWTPFIVALARTSSKAAKQLNTLSKSPKVARGRTFVFSSEMVKNDKGRFAVAVLSIGGVIPEDVAEYTYRMSIESGNLAERVDVRHGGLDEFVGQNGAVISPSDEEIPF